MSDPLLSDAAPVASWDGDGAAARTKTRDRDSDVWHGFSDPGLYTSLLPAPLLTAHSPHRLAQDPRMAAAWSCSQRLLQPLDQMVSTAWDMHSTGAYVHHYERCGLEADDFMYAFATMETVARDYTDM
jgi:hypothetical protein